MRDWVSVTVRVRVRVSFRARVRVILGWVRYGKVYCQV